MERPNKKPTLIQTIVEELLAAASADQLQRASANPQATRREFSKIVQKRIKNMSAETLALIGTHGKAHPSQTGTSVHQIMPEDLPIKRHPRASLRRLAVATILAEMYDRIREARNPTENPNH